MLVLLGSHAFDKKTFERRGQAMETFLQFINPANREVWLMFWQGYSTNINSPFVQNDLIFSNVFKMVANKNIIKTLFMECFVFFEYILVGYSSKIILIL